jgi:hypothetical protein
MGGIKEEFVEAKYDNLSGGWRSKEVSRPFGV